MINRFSHHTTIPARRQITPQSQPQTDDTVMVWQPQPSQPLGQSYNYPIPQDNHTTTPAFGPIIQPSHSSGHHTTTPAFGPIKQLSHSSEQSHNHPSPQAYHTTIPATVPLAQPSRTSCQSNNLPIHTTIPAIRQIRQSSQPAPVAL
jgi:hypothetical protein